MTWRNCFQNSFKFSLRRYTEARRATTSAFEQPDGMLVLVPWEASRPEDEDATGPTPPQS
jgi:hypothetical protein